MSENPYVTPQTSPQLQPESDEFFNVVLASRWLRFGASLIDGIILLALVFAVAFPLAYFDFEIESSPARDSLFPFSNLSEGIVGELINTALAIVIYLAVNGYFMVKSGQTVGKKALGIQVVSYQTHQLLSPGMMIGMRFVLTSILNYIPLFTLVDIVCIFGGEKRCIHDQMAGSIVINRNPAL